MTITAASATPLFQPFPDQQKALDMMLHGGHQLFRLHGNAGSGKTSLITKGLIPQVTGKRIAVCAFTHRACGVVREKLGDAQVEVITSSSLLGFKPAKGKVDASTEFHRNKTKSQFGHYDLIIFDEASMLPQEHIDAVLEDMQLFPNRQVIFVGDDAQLPPVNAEGSIAPAFVLDIPEYGLQQVRRNAGAILDYATVIRSNEPGFRLKVQEHLEPTGSVILTETRERTMNRIKELVDIEVAQGVDETFIVLGYTNRQVKEWNSLIRRYRYGKDADPFVEGELLISKTVIYPRGEENLDDPQPIGASSSELKITSKPTKVKHLPDNRVLKAHFPDGFECWSFKADCDQAEGEISLLAVDPADWAGYEKVVNFLFKKGQQVRAERDDNDLKRMRGEDADVEQFKSREWFMAAWTLVRTFGHEVQPRYARTVHKSQGGEWFNTFVDVSDLKICKKRNKKEYRSLLYTAMTRAGQNLYLTKADL